ncbi:MAG: hypothetical protein RLZZ387_5486 [Chloroflexota bacterium]|jgi:hypothetical protein
MGAVTGALVLTIGLGWQPRVGLEPLGSAGEPPAKPLLATAPEAPAVAAARAAPQPPKPQQEVPGQRQKYVAEPSHAPTPQSQPAQQPAGGQVVVVTATAPLFPTMAPVAVTPTAALTQAEEEARARAAIEAMRQSTESMQSDMPPLPGQP